MPRLRRIAASALLCSVAVGCNTQAKWTYPINPTGLFHGKADRTRFVVAVLPFKEERPVTNQTATFLLYLVPLVPYGWVTYERPEAARMFNTIAQYDFTLDEDLGKAAARSFDDSGLFRRVYFTLGGSGVERERSGHDGKSHTGSHPLESTLIRSNLLSASPRAGQCRDHQRVLLGAVGG